MLTDIAYRARATVPADAVWRECARCGLPAPLAADAVRCLACESPIRIQRRRTAGRTMPPGAVFAGWPTKFGNPFRAEPATPAARAVVDRNREWLAPCPALVAAASRELGHTDMLLTVARGEAL